jgi:hypothetical protein
MAFHRTGLPEKRLRKVLNTGTWKLFNCRRRAISICMVGHKAAETDLLS